MRPRPRRRTSRRAGTRAGRRSRAAAGAPPPRSRPRPLRCPRRIAPARLRRSQSPATSDSTSPIESSAARIWSSSTLEERVHVLRHLLERVPRRRGAGVELARAVRLEERLGERAADAHRLADRLHLRAERPVGAGELLEREARELDDDVVERRLEARRASSPSGRSGSRRACSRRRAAPRPSRSDTRSPSTRARTSARRAGSSRSRARRRSHGCARTGCSSRRCRRRRRG